MNAQRFILCSREMKQKLQTYNIHAFRAKKSTNLYLFCYTLLEIEHY